MYKTAHRKRPHRVQRCFLPQARFHFFSGAFYHQRGGGAGGPRFNLGSLLTIRISVIGRMQTHSTES